jgi:hypothetical protein
MIRGQRGRRLGGGSAASAQSLVRSSSSLGSSLKLHAIALRVRESAQRVGRRQGSLLGVPEAAVSKYTRS